jgi:predicted membrane-bound spermidine synthase
VADFPYLGLMLRALLMGLAALIIAVVVISVLVHVLFFGFVLVLVAAVTFVVFRAGRRPGGRFRR